MSEEFAPDPDDPARARPRPPLFLARQSYRRRRMMDASRLMPLFGFILVLLPILWRPAETPGPDTARGVVYLFAVWFGLILLAFGLARGLKPALDEEAEAAAPTTLDAR